MAKELVTDELWETIEPLLPTEPPKPQGGRPRIDDRAALFRHRLRAKERYPLGDAAPRDGLRLWDDLLETPEGVARGRGVGEAAPSPSRPPRRGRPDRVGGGRRPQWLETSVRWRIGELPRILLPRSS
jgi:hypothetical protein